MYLAVESSGMALLRDSIVPVSTISCKKDPGMMRLVKPRRIMPALPTGCATSFPSTAIRFESVLHRCSVSSKSRCLNPCPWTSASVERACRGASIEHTAGFASGGCG